MIYLDYAATTPPYDEVADTMYEVMKRHYGNPSSLHKLGVDAEQLVSGARETIARTLSVSASEIVFTGCGTESNHLAVYGAARKYRERGNHLITTEIEHASVYETCRRLQNEGYRVTYLPVDSGGRVRLADLENAITSETILVSVMFVNNEVGTIQPIQEIGRLLSGRLTLFHVDGVQAYGKLKVNPRQLGIDMMSGSAHKFRGPKGTGFLYRREGIELEPALLGGGQERGLRSGTENVPAIVGMAKAARMAVEQQPLFYERMRAVRETFKTGLSAIEGIMLNGSSVEAEMAPHIVHFSFPGMKSEVVVHALEQRGFAISTRSACSSGEQTPSRVLTAMGHGADRSTSGLRISCGLDVTEKDAEAFCLALSQAAEQLHRPLKRQAKGRQL
jgi:cysteine desulfurase